MLTDIIGNVWAAIIVLGVMVVVHEWGHYAAAKLCGVRVETFSVGFGKRLFGFRRGDTDYRVSLIPLGGYVKMAGENPLDASTGAPDEFMSKPRWQRFIIALAGPAANIVLAIAIMTGVFMVHYEHAAYEEQPAVLGYVEPDSPAGKAGLKPGDRIIRVEDIQNPTWKDLFFKVVLSPNRPLDIAVQRGAEIQSLSITPKVDELEMGDAGWEPLTPIEVVRLERDMPAAKAGLQLGDIITHVNGAPAAGADGFRTQMKYTKSEPVHLAVKRGQQELQLTINPVETDMNGEKVWRIGFLPFDERHVDKLPFGAAFTRATAECWRFTGLILELVQRMVQGQISIKQMDGPIGIGTAAGEAMRQEGWIPLLGLMALISVNLGVFNLFPIPIMDGGVIVMLAIEGIMRRDISLRIKERIYQASFVFLLIFATVVIYNDIAKTSIGRFLP